MIDDGFTSQGVTTPATLKRDDRRRLSPFAVDRIVRAAAGLLGAVDGMARVRDVPAMIASPLLAEPAAQLRRELVDAGVIAAAEVSVARADLGDIGIREVRPPASHAIVGALKPMAARPRS